MSSGHPLAVALHDIRSLYNVGSIFRSASGAGFDHLYISGYTGSPPNHKISKVALGAEETLPFSHAGDLNGLLETLTDHYVVVLEQHPSSKPYWELDLPQDKPTTLVVGGEILGVPQELIERSDAIVEIPMAGSKESLNVACAFSIVGYEFTRNLGKLLPSDLRSRA